MKVKNKSYRYSEWLSPEEMHAMSVQWLSKLKFAKDEQLFLNDLVRNYTLQLVEGDIFEKSKVIVKDLSNAEKEVIILMKKVQVHENQLNIMTDDVNQLPMEKAYIQAHKELLSEIEHYSAEYRELKVKLFGLLTDIMKKQKQHRLLH
ncbi:hypothetical protein [Pareuzebyella sediminis]|uniref:hypothetical protein n=1 Tax=Pareuzebyella sediminis TaxID=2607998 RepID=UPI0011ED42CC|nr:hypothetical protein [Pareuzebyella sediminis]